MESLKGKLLIASPGLMDPNFTRSVVIVAEHNDEGALGLVLNRKGPAKVAELWSTISSEEASTTAHAYVGGPVQSNAVLLLHGYPDLAPGTEPIVPGVYMGSEVEVFGSLIRRDEGAGGGKYRVFCGYAGWGPGQLDGEMKAGGWLTLPATVEHVFEHPPETLWQRALGTIGGVYKFFSLMPPNPEHN